MSQLDVAGIKKDFPILDDPDLVFLDSAASSQRPRQVVEAVSNFYYNDYANVHRGVYKLAERSTNAFEHARKTVANFVGANSNEIVFVKNATEAINIVAISWAAENLEAGDKIVLTMLEHHANVVPWQMLAEKLELVVAWINVDEEGRLDMDDARSKLNDAKLLCFSAMSNVTGTITPAKELCELAKANGTTTVVDACQLVPHCNVDFADMGADFAAFSGHKMLGPSGIGVLFARSELLEEMPPFLGGGGMISTVTTEGFTAASGPAKFEAGTPPIAQAVGLTAAIEYLETIGMDKIMSHEKSLVDYCLDTLPVVVGDGLKIHGPTDSKDRGAVFSLELEGIHAHDTAQVLDSHGVCVRPGHHCAKPLMKNYQVAASARASFYLYNDRSDVDRLGQALLEAKKFFGA